MDFGYRDRKRKLQSLEATGGDWRPHPGFFKFVGRFAPNPQGGTRRSTFWDGTSAQETTRASWW